MISIVVPVHPSHDRRDLLEQKLHALEGQGHGFEVILAANSPLSFLEDFHPSYPLTKLQTDKLEAGPKRNQGATAARGEYLIFSDDDVVPEVGWLGAFQSAFAKGAAIYLGAFDFVEGQPWQPALRMGEVSFNNVNGVALGLPKTWFDKVGGFAQWLEGYGGEDLELGYRLVRAGFPLRYLKEAKAKHLGPTPALDLKKARLAGSQAARIARHHNDAKLALELGVHPVLLVLKMALLPSFKGLLGVKGDYELAYASGAWETRYDDPHTSSPKGSGR